MNRLTFNRLAGESVVFHVGDQQVAQVLIRAICKEGVAIVVSADNKQTKGFIPYGLPYSMRGKWLMQDAIDIYAKYLTPRRTGLLIRASSNVVVYREEILTK